LKLVNSGCDTQVYETLGEIHKVIQQMAAGCHNPEPDTQNDSESASQPPPVKRMRPDGETSKNLFGDFSRTC